MALYDSLMNEKRDRSLRVDEFLTLYKHLGLDSMVFYSDEQEALIKHALVS